MAVFRFIHAADIHLDSPLRGLARYEGVPLDEVRGATRAAFDKLVQFAIDESVDFVVIAGDVFDGDWRDMGTGLHFTRALTRLGRAGIPVFFLGGNHDAASVLTRSLPWPENVVKVFGHRAPETFRLDGLSVALHGQGFATQHVHDDLSLAYPEPLQGFFNIGVLHTALEGAEGHAPYAPCTVAALQAKGYDYWALGHVHDFREVSVRPRIVFPGNLQGRNVRETGPKGAVLVEVQDREIASLTRVPLDVVRWSVAVADCAGADSIEAVFEAVRRCLSRAEAELSDGRPLIVRLTLRGATPLAGLLRDRAAEFRDEARALAASIGPDLWLERVVLDVVSPSVVNPALDTVPDDFLSLLSEASRSDDLAAALAEDLRTFMAARPPRGDLEAGMLDNAAARGDWGALIDAAVAALPARLAARRA
jgi:DNA repair exonuclease SbcCD nuclease subunit